MERDYDSITTDNLQYLNLDSMPAGKRKVLLAALTLFSKNGFNGTSTAQIAETAAVSQATIFKYFKTKQELLLAIVEPLQQSFKHYFSDQVKNIDNLDDIVAFIVKERFTFFTQHTSLLKIIVQEFMVNKDIQHVMQRNVITWKPDIDTYLAKLKQNHSDLNQYLTAFDFVRIIYGTLIIYFIQHSLVTDIFPTQKPNLDIITKEILLLLRNTN